MKRSACVDISKTGAIIVFSCEDCPIDPELMCIQKGYGLNSICEHFNGVSTIYPKAELDCEFEPSD